MADIREYADSLLANSGEIAVDGVAETTLFTVPAGKSCIITKVIMHSPTAAIGQASISFGFNAGAGANDVITNGVRALTGATNYEIIPAKSDAVRGVAGGTFNMIINTPETAADKAKFAVYGFLY